MLKFYSQDGCIRFHRAQFLDAFVNHLPEGIAHFGRRLLSYTSHEDGQSIEMTFADGSLEYCDVLIGCDGIKSMVRKQMLERKDADGLPGLRRFVEPVWSGITAYRGLISSSAFSKDSNGHLHSATQRPMMVSTNFDLLYYDVSDRLCSTAGTAK